MKSMMKSPHFIYSGRAVPRDAQASGALLAQRGYFAAFDLPTFVLKFAHIFMKDSGL